ncbi:MAG: hypothetical protein N4A63_12975 [Vallitalea sp.]|nr:hypothetical protein [Vallitalea sp.]
MKRFIAVDFDGTLVENCFPDIGPLKVDVVTRVKKEKEKGNTIILWTCRGGEELKAAVKFLEENNVPIDFINQNPLNPLGDGTRKIFAHEYWDDRAIRIH